VRRIALLLLLPLAACQPSARRVLLVDFNLSDPLTLETTAAPWSDAGYRVEYRRFYPHLTRADLMRYRTLVLFGGGEPERSSDALTIGDLAILTEWVRRDGVVVLGYEPDPNLNQNAGSFDRWIMNRWLAAQGAGIVIGTDPTDVPAVPLPHSALDNAGFQPFPAGRSQPLAVRNRDQILARGSATALVAASRVGDGLIVVASRNLLGAAREDRRSRDFLVALARWTRRPAEWATIDPAVRPVPLRLANAPRPVATHPPPLLPPKGADVARVPEPVPPYGRDDQPLVPLWITRQGVRALWTRYTPQSFEASLDFAETAALNALATVIPANALTDTIAVRTSWRPIADELQTTSFRWFPGVALTDLGTQGPNADEVDRHGELTAVACGLDSVFWRTVLRPTFRALVRLGGARPEVLAGVALDLDSATSQYAAAGFCDMDYRIGLAALAARLDPTDVDRLIVLPPAARYDSLLERGLLGSYFSALENAVAERATALRNEVRRLHPDVRFAFRATRPPADWFTLGLLRGLSARESPALLFTAERNAHELVSRYNERGVVALTALKYVPDRERLSRPLMFGEHTGFWLEGLSSDSLARSLRRFTKEALPGTPTVR
jgi:hypothetical protein